MAQVQPTLWLLAVLAAAPAACHGASPRPPEAVAVATVQNDTGRPDVEARAESALLRDAITRALQASGVQVAGQSRTAVGLILQPTLIQCSYPARGETPDSATPPCFGSVRTVDAASQRVLHEIVVQAPVENGAAGLGAAMARAALAATEAPPVAAETGGTDISAAGATVRHLGGPRFLAGGAVIDLQRIGYVHDPAIDTDVPAGTDITLPDATPRDPAHAVITLYQIDPPLTGLPSREPGIDRGTDMRDPANLVKAAYTNYVSPVFTDDPSPVKVASHPIGHFIVRVEVPGYPVLLTGMTTIARADTELVDLTLGRQLGIGGVLLTPEPGRLNAAAEVARELALRQRRLRIMDGLYFRGDNGRNLGPEYIAEDGRVRFARFVMPVANGTDALAWFAEFIRRGEQNRFDSLLNTPFKGTGAGCAGFAMGWLQAAGVVPFVIQPPAAPPPAEPEALGPSEVWRAVRADLDIPWRLIGCNARVGAARPVPADLTIYDLLFHAEAPSFIRAASQGLAAHIRREYGTVPAALFQIGALTPLRDLVIDGKRKDPSDRGDYTWAGDGLDIPYWDNSHFSTWIRRVWANSPRDPRVTLAREGRFRGLQIDATAAPRQQAPFFAEADRIATLRAAGVSPAPTCRGAFAQGLE